MGFFSRPVESNDPFEMRLVNEYAQAFQSLGISAAEARKNASEMVADARQEVERRGWSGHGTSYGDIVLRQEPQNRELHEWLAALRADGVRDADIRWWWNMHPLERVMIEKSDELNRTSAFLTCLKQGLDADAATKKVFQAHAKFGDPREGTGDDRPLPTELKNRILDFLERQYMNPWSWRARMDASSSFNAIVRAEIRAGNL